MERSLYWCIGVYEYWLIPTLQLSPSNKFKESVVSSLFNRAYFIIINKDDLLKRKP